MLINALKEQGLREALPEGTRRHPWKLAHGLRKYFETRLEEARMRQLKVARLMSHKTGIADHYRRQLEETVLEDYLAAVDLLTISNDKLSIQRQVSKLTEATVNENEKMQKIITDMQSRQTAIETILRKMVASDLDVDINDPEEQERIARTLEKVLTNKWNLFSE